MLRAVTLDPFADLSAYAAAAAERKMETVKTLVMMSAHNALAEPPSASGVTLEDISDLVSAQLGRWAEAAGAVALERIQAIRHRRTPVGLAP